MSTFRSDSADVRQGTSRPKPPVLKANATRPSTPKAAAVSLKMAYRAATHLRAHYKPVDVVVVAAVVAEPAVAQALRAELPAAVVDAAAAVAAAVRQAA